MIISWNGGIELVYPVADDPVYQQYLEKHGERFYAIVFGVEGLELSVTHIENI